MGEKDTADLHRRLKKLSRGKPVKAKVETHPGVEASLLPDGEELDTPFGSAYRIESTFALDHRHGDLELSRILSFSGSLAAKITKQSSFEGIPLEQLAFLDTETTGLAGGAGTLVFLVGIGTFVEDQFRFRQYFLRDPGEEPGMLQVLKDDLDTALGFVTYNGRAFDLPLLEGRYTLSLREKIPLNTFPNFDLLHLARRLWRHSLPDCTLGTVESKILGVRRTEEDVPGAWIPGMYLDYLRSGDAREMRRVIYHNAVDVLSLVGLAGYMLDRHSDEKLNELTASESLAVARWHQDAGRSESAESAYRKAMRSRKVDVKTEAMRRYSLQLKRIDRKPEAVKIWQKWHKLSVDDPAPCIELAKYYEWELGDYTEALHWSQEGMQSLTHWPKDWRRDRAWEELEHRIRRLKKKLDS